MYLFAVHDEVTVNSKEDPRFVGYVVKIHIRHSDAIIIVQRDDFVVGVRIHHITVFDYTAK